MLHYQLSRRVYFSAAHRYEVPSWTADRNKSFFGSCYSSHGHGHNYILEAYVSGALDPLTGMIINLADLDKILKASVEVLDHSFLNELPYFSNSVPTTENIAGYLYDEISKQIPKNISLDKLRLYENEDLWAEVSP